ncbi:MAG: DUF488 domain-containing protein [ANME-2 cluster archaeon]|nr:DUF488 domain-containing protein [ANME-2 cluster archaeon]
MTPRQTTLAGIESGIRIYSIGYGGRILKDIVKQLGSMDVEKLIDVRSYPNTRWFGKQHLENMLGDNYASIPILGGKDFSPHQYKEWKAKVPKQVLDDLVRLSDDHIICLICAEKDHRKCHRSYFVGRALKEDYGLEVRHI